MGNYNDLTHEQMNWASTPRLDTHVETSDNTDKLVVDLVLDIWILFTSYAPELDEPVEVVINLAATSDDDTWLFIIGS